jgi:golgin subfamily B member 1
VSNGNKSTLAQLEAQLRKDPGAGPLLRMAERVARREGAFGLLGDFLADAVLAVTRDRKLELCLKLGNLYRDDIGYFEEAARWYLQALEEGPKKSRAFECLVPLCDETGQWEILVEGLLLRASVVSEEAAGLKRQAALLRLGNSDEPESAIPLFEEVFELEPGDPATAEILMDHYGNTEQWRKLAAVYEGLLTTTEDPADRVELLKKLALLRETVIEDTGAAAQNYQEILDLLPDDLGALQELERLYVEQQQPEELAKVLRGMVVHADTVGDKVALLERIATIATRDTGDRETAVATLQEILEHDPGHLQSLAELDTLLSAAEDWEGVIDLIDRRIHLSSDAEEVVALFLRKGGLFHHELGSISQAEEQYRAVLELVPGDPTAIERITDLLVGAGKFDRVMEFLLRRARHSEDEQEQARLLTRMAMVSLEHLNDRNNGVELLEAALQRAPRYGDAIAPLTALYIEDEKWTKALPLLEILRETAAESGQPKQEGEVLTRMGKCLRLIGRAEDALAYYRGAYDKGAEDASVLRALGELNLAAGNNEVANNYFGSFIDGLTEEEIAVEGSVVYSTMASIQQALGKEQAAREWLEKALDSAPEDATAIASLIQVAEHQHDHQRANEHRRQLAQLQTDPLEQLASYIAIGDTCREKLDDSHGAKEAYEHALSLVADSKIPHLKLLELHAAAGDHRATAESLRALVTLETDGTRQLSFAFARASLLHREMDESVEAAAAYEAVLDLNPEHIEALKAVLELHSVNEDWGAMEVCYLQMLDRLDGKGRRDLEHVLLRGLGELYELHVERPTDAIAAYRQALQRKSDDVELRAALAELLEAAEEWSASIAEYRKLVQLNPDNPAFYRKLARHSHNIGAKDDAWFSVSVLAALGQATDKELEWLTGARPALATGPLTLEHWHGGLRSNAQELELSELFGLLATVLGPTLKSKSFREADVHKRDRIDTKDDSAFAATLRRVSKLLGMPVPDAYRVEGFLGMDIRPTAPPVLVVGDVFLRGADTGVVAFMLGRTLTWFHPWHVLAAYFPPDGLRFLLSSALSFVNPSADDLAIEDTEVMALHKQLTKRLGADGEATLEKLVGGLTSTSVSRWLSGIELTSNHAGLLACGDVKTALTGLQTDPFSRSRLPKAEQAKELAVFATSSDFAALRRWWTASPR